MKERKLNKYLVYEIQKYKRNLRALIWHIEIDIKGNCTLKSIYSTYVNMDTWDSYCTCIGFQMRKKPCIHLRELFKDEKYKRMCKE